MAITNSQIPINQLPTILQGVTSQNLAGGSPAMNNSSGVTAPGTANPADATGRPGYLAVGQPGGNNADTLVPGGQYNTDNQIQLIGAPAGTAGGGGYYPGPVNPMLAPGWTNQQTDIDNSEYELTISTSSPLAGSTHAVAMTSVTFAASGGEGSLTWSAPQGVPDGVALSTGGVLSGTPAAAGTFSFTIQVVDGEGNHADKWFTWTVA